MFSNMGRNPPPVVGVGKPRHRTPCDCVLDSFATGEHNDLIFSTCLALRRAQRIEREVGEAEEARAACAQLLYKRSEQDFSVTLSSPQNQDDGSSWTGDGGHTFDRLAKEASSPVRSSHSNRLFQLP